MEEMLIYFKFGIDDPGGIYAFLGVVMLTILLSLFSAYEINHKVK